MRYLLRMLQSPSPAPSGIGCHNFPPACITDLSTLSNLLLPLIYIGASLFLLGMLLFAGFTYLQAGDNPGNVKVAQQTASYAVLGIVIIVVAYGLVRLIAYVLDIPFLL